MLKERTFLQHWHTFFGFLTERDMKDMKGERSRGMGRNIVICVLAALVLVFTLINANYLIAQVCPNPPVRTAAGGSYYGLQDAYDAALDGDTILSQAVVFNENLDFNRNISVTITGGYDCYYSTNVQKSVVNGTITIRNGTVTIENITIR
jgi:hypothetical protein